MTNAIVALNSMAGQCEKENRRQIDGKKLLRCEVKNMRELIGTGDILINLADYIMLFIILSLIVANFFHFLIGESV